jgi:hypothetical protein
MILYLRDPKNSTKKVLDLLNIFSKVAGYIINTQKISSISIHNEQSEKEIRKTIPFTKLQKIEIPRNNFNEKTERSIYNENYKSLKKKNQQRC